MKRIITSVVATALLTISAFAGNCGGTSTVLPKAQTGVPGFTPIPDSFPVMIKGATIDQTVYIENYDTTRASGTLITILSLKIDSIENLPTGLCWKTNKTNNTFAGKETGVIQITGRTTDPAGQYKLRIKATVVTNLVTLVKVDLESALGIRYYVRVGCQGFTPVKVDTASPYPTFKAYSGQVCAPLPSVSLTATSSTIPEAAGVTKFIATLSATSTSTVTANLSLTGNALLNADYTLNKSSFSIAPGKIADTIIVNTIDDAFFETNENIIGTLSTPTNSGIGTPSSQTVVITDNDMPKVSLLGYVDTVSESVGMVKLVATLSTPTVGTATVDLSFSGTATLPSDFTLSKTAFLFNQGQSKDTITVTIVNDLISEPTESVTFSLTNPMGIALNAPTTHTLTILDNDASGIMNNEIMKAIAVYPSPAQEGFNIALPYYKENLSVVIVNAEGKMLKQAKLNQGTNTISTEGMATGSYSILFSNDERQIIGLKTIQICK